MIGIQQVRTFIEENKLTLKQADMVSIETLQTGMTNKNFKCTFSNGQIYIIRFPGNGSPFLINRNAEWSNYKKIKPLGLDAETIYFDKTTGIKVTKFIENYFFSIKSSEQKIRNACKCLKRIHYSKIQFANEFSVLDMIERYKKVAQDLSIKMDEDFFEVQKTLQKNNIHSYLKKNSTFCACHNDPVPDNFLLNKKADIFLIDWEYSGMNDPVWDLAAFSMESNLTQEEENYLLYYYYEGVYMNEKKILLFSLYKVLQDVLWYLWAKIKINFGNDFSAYADMRICRAKYHVRNILC